MIGKYEITSKSIIDAHVKPPDGFLKIVLTKYDSNMIVTYTLGLN